MNILEILGLIGATLGPLSGIVIAIIVDRRSKRTGEAGTQVSTQSVRVNEKEAHTHEMSVIIEGFTQSLEALRIDLERTQKELASEREANEPLRQQVRELKDWKDDMEGQREEMISHIVALEGLVPSPPGPPARPAWS